MSTSLLSGALLTLLFALLPLCPHGLLVNKVNSDQVVLPGDYGIVSVAESSFIGLITFELSCRVQFLDEQFWPKLLMSEGERTQVVFNLVSSHPP